MSSTSCTVCMSPTVCILLLWAGFAATHIGLSTLPARRESLRGVRELSPTIIALGIGATVLARYLEFGD